MHDELGGLPWSSLLRLFFIDGVVMPAVGAESPPARLAPARHPASNEKSTGRGMLSNSAGRMLQG
jgi:hypothetical protein